jgi:hypothetical protein
MSYVFRYLLSKRYILKPRYKIPTLKVILS